MLVIFLFISIIDSGYWVASNRLGCKLRTNPKMCVDKVYGGKLWFEHIVILLRDL